MSFPEMTPRKSPRPRARIVRLALYPMGVALAYAVVCIAGYLFPKGAYVGWALATVVFFSAWIIGVQFLVVPGDRKKDPGVWSLGLVLILLTVGSATIGNVTYRARAGELTTVTLTSVEEYTTGSRRAPRRHHHDFGIADPATGASLGTLKLVGTWVDFEVGDDVEVIVDPNGKISPRLPDDTNSLPRVVLGTGAILFPLVWVWQAWLYSRRLRRAGQVGAVLG